MTIFYTGTTLENAVQIFGEGCLSITPPHRVWENYSKNYIYLLSEEANDDESLELAFEQSAYAIHVLNHSKRVIFAIEGLSEELLETDTDINAFDSLRYPKNIFLNEIKEIYVEKKDSSDELKRLIALTDFIERNSYDYFRQKYYNLFYNREITLKEIGEELRIFNFDLINPVTLFDENKLQEYYVDLIDWHRRQDLFDVYTVEKFAETFL